MVLNLLSKVLGRQYPGGSPGNAISIQYGEFMRMSLIIQVPLDSATKGGLGTAQKPLILHFIPLGFCMKSLQSLVIDAEAPSSNIIGAESELKVELVCSL